jgi:hypothetical protein
VIPRYNNKYWKGVGSSSERQRMVVAAQFLPKNSFLGMFWGDTIVTEREDDQEVAEDPTGVKGLNHQ